jgi:hypothetical protein
MVLSFLMVLSLFMQRYLSRSIWRGRVHGIRRRLLRQCSVRELLSTLECRLFDRHRFRIQAEVKMAIFEYIEAWYNPIAVTPGLIIFPPWSM